MRQLIQCFSLCAIILVAGLAFANAPLGDWGSVISPGIDATGGPDDFGYIWMDQDEPSGPTYGWIDITTTGSLVTGLGDDNWVGPYDMGFAFRYYWYDVVEFYIGSNGYLKFGSPYNMAQPFPASIPLTAMPNDFIGVYIADWYPGQSGQGSVYQWTNNVDSLIVSYIDIPEWTTTPPAGSHDFQVIFTDTDSSITFQYGSQTGIVSNNDILVGIECVSGQVGLEHSHDVYAITNTAVKFYYPDVITYEVHDLAAHAVANEASEGFFLLTGEDYNPMAIVKNTGNQTESSYTAVLRIQQEQGGAFVYSEVYAGGTIAAGEEQVINYPVTWAPADVGQYFVTLTVNLTGDMNPANNNKAAECHAMVLPGTMLYDDGTSEQSWGWMGGDGGLGQRFVPPAYPVTLEDIQFYITAVSTTPNFTAKIYDDDGPGGSPGTELFTELVSTPVANQWYVVDIPALDIEITDGAFYVGWHMTGDNSTELGTDSTPTQLGSRQSWEFTGVWAPFRNAETQDVMIRTGIYQPGTTPNFTVTLTYNYGSPVPAGGGAVNFDVFLQNNEPTSQNFDLWIEIPPQITPPGVPNRNLTFPSGFSITRPDMNWPIPGNWPAGAYWMEWYVGDLATTTAWASDSFPFVKSADDDGSGYVLWEVDYDPLEGLFEGLDLGETMVVSDFALLGSYPNPFNPSTTISYVLPEASKVTLTVYDINGRQVAELVNGWRAMGVQEAVFDASNLASGLYIYNLTAGTFNATGKMVLMK